MSKVLKSVIGVILIAIIGSNQAYAQNDHLFKDVRFKNPSSTETYLYTIETKSGSSYIGEMIRIRNGQLTILNKDVGNLELQISDITNIEPYDPSSNQDEEDLTSNALEYNRAERGMVGASHYFISPSAYTLKKGEGELQVAYIFFLSGSYGVTDNFSISGGTSIVPAVSLDEQLLYLIPRVSARIAPNVRLGGQLILISAFDEDFSLASLTSSFGTEDQNLSVGLSYGFANGDITRIPLISVAGVLRVSKKIAFMTDNLILTDDLSSDGSLYSFGFRIMTGSSAFDFGAFIISEYAFPYLNYTIRF